MKPELAIIGLGRMGGNLATQSLRKGLVTFGFNPGGVSSALVKEGLIPLSQLSDLLAAMEHPRVIFLYAPAGTIVDQVIENLSAVLEPGDIVVDGGNSYWRDSIARHRMLKEKGIEFVDLGTSGGPSGALHGATFMIGGEDQVVAYILPILKLLSVPGGTVHAGPPGTGHFVKLVHNGIEFGMMQAIAEGLDLLEHHDDRINIAEVLETWRHGTVIRSWLIDLLAMSYQSLDGFSSIDGYVEDTGEVNWLVQDAAAMEVPIPVIAQSVWQLMASRDQTKIWAKAIAAMRHGFGGHPFGPNKAIEDYRKSSRSQVACASPTSGASLNADGALSSDDGSNGFHL